MKNKGKSLLLLQHMNAGEGVVLWAQAHSLLINLLPLLGFKIFVNLWIDYYDHNNIDC
jgi:hypothetical protein